MDFLTLIGVIIAFGAIILGQFLEGGHLATLVNGPAFLIVTGGTLGAIMVQSPLHIFLRSMRILPWLIKPPVIPMQESLDKLLSWSNVARREGLLGPGENFGNQSQNFFPVKVCSYWLMVMNLKWFVRAWNWRLFPRKIVIFRLQKYLKAWRVCTYCRNYRCRDGINSRHGQSL